MICKQFDIQKVHTSSLFIDYFDDIAPFDVKNTCTYCSCILFFFSNKTLLLGVDCLLVDLYIIYI